MKVFNGLLMIICFFFTPEPASAGEDVITTLMMAENDKVPLGMHETLSHILSSQIFPELDKAISQALEDKPEIHTVGALDKTARIAYKQWHSHVQSITNIRIPEPTLLLTKHLNPAGFSLTNEKHLPANWKKREPDWAHYHYQLLVMGRIILTISTAATLNSNLSSVKQALDQLFNCDHFSECNEWVQKQQPDNAPLDPTEGVRLYSECLRQYDSSTLSETNKDLFCEFLTAPIISTH